MLDSNGNRIVEVGHGFVDGEDSYCLDAVRKARKEYRCEGVIRAVRGAETFPPAGDALFHGESDDCTEKILKGDLHAVLIINNVKRIFISKSFNFSSQYSHTDRMECSNNREKSSVICAKN